MLAGWRNWQTQGSQKPPRAISYRFDSDTRHHLVTSPKINAMIPRCGQSGPRLIFAKKKSNFTHFLTQSPVVHRYHADYTIVIGRRSGLKICRPLWSWGFDPPSRHHLSTCLLSSIYLEIRVSMVGEMYQFPLFRRNRVPNLFAFRRFAIQRRFLSAVFPGTKPTFRHQFVSVHHDQEFHPA